MPGLSWSVRSTFLRYVSALPDGRIHVTEGAGLAEGQFSFPEGLAAPRIRRFTGQVAFTGHFGLLSVTIAEPWLDWSGDTCLLTIADPDRGRLPLATCLVASDRVTRAWLGREVRLTEEGAALFGGSYAVGEPLDAFTIHPGGPAGPAPDHRLVLAGATAP